MSLLSKAKEAFLSRIVEVCATSITILLAWVASIVGPAVWPAVSAAMPTEALLPAFLLSLLLNLIFGVLLYFGTRKSEPEFQLKYGIYWDRNKNPHCPVCQKPVTYGSWHNNRLGYYCNPCRKLTLLRDPAGNEVMPEQVFL